MNFSIILNISILYLHPSSMLELIVLPFRQGSPVYFVAAGRSVAVSRDLRLRKSDFSSRRKILTRLSFKMSETTKMTDQHNRSSAPVS